MTGGGAALIIDAPSNAFREPINAIIQKKTATFNSVSDEWS